MIFQWEPDLTFFKWSRNWKYCHSKQAPVAKKMQKNAPNMAQTLHLESGNRPLRIYPWCITTLDCLCGTLVGRTELKSGFFLCVSRETRFCQKAQNSIFSPWNSIFSHETRFSGNFDLILLNKILFDIKNCMGWPFLLHFYYQNLGEKGIFLESSAVIYKILWKK